MPITVSSSTNFPAARYAAFIQKTLLEPGELVISFRDFMDEKKLDKGYSTTYTIIRRARIKVPVAPSGEAVSPTPQSLNLDTVSGTATQYVLSIQFSDVIDLVALHDMITHAALSVKDAMDRLDGKVCSDAYMANLNIFYANTTYTARTQLLATDALTSDSIKKAVVNLRKGDRVIGAAPRWRGTYFWGLVNENVVADLRKDATWESAATRDAQGQAGKMQEATVKLWEGVEWNVSNFMPELTCLNDGLSTLALTNNTALSYTSSDTIGTGVNGFTVNFSGASGTFAAVGYTWVVTRIDQYRGFEEDLSSGLTLTASANNTATVTFPTDASSLSLQTPGLALVNGALAPRFLYNLYVGTTSGAVFRLAAQYQLGGTTVVIAGPPASGTSAPVAPTNQTTSTATRIKIYPTWLGGKNWGAAVTLDAMKTYITPTTPTDSDPAVQRRTVAAKLFMGSFVVRDQYVARIESGSNFPGA
jgi:N4-gp56 family major capsid protein